MAAPKQITLRNVPPDLARRLKALAQERAASVNTVALQILAEGVGIDARRKRLLDRYATWTSEDGKVFDASLRDQRTIDADAWK